jgi:hypothetical protein
MSRSIVATGNRFKLEHYPGVTIRDARGGHRRVREPDSRLFSRERESPHAVRTLGGSEALSNMGFRRKLRLPATMRAATARALLVPAF